jgi:hypothetical protein
MGRLVLNWVCVLALVALPVGGCGSDETTATGGAGGSGDTPGDSGLGGVGGDGGTAGTGGAGGMGGTGGTGAQGGTGGMGGDGGTAGTGGVAQACGAVGTGGAGGLALITKMIPVACCDNATLCQDRRFPYGAQPYQLTVDPRGSVSPGAQTAVDLGGKAVLSETAVDKLQGAIPGGATEIDLVDLAATVQIRSGGTMAPVVLTNSPLPATCLIPSPTEPTSCDPANDGASVPGSRPNTDCVPTGTFNPCRHMVVFPTSDDCSVGGVCELIGKRRQCDINGFCATGGVEIPFETKACAFTANASGDVLFGWAEDVPGQSEHPNGSIAPPPATFAGPVPPIGMRFIISGLNFALQCTMAQEGDTCVGGTDDGLGCGDDGDCAGGGTCSGGMAEVFVPVPNADLISIPIVE